MLWVILILLIAVIILLVAIWLRLRPEKPSMKQDEPPKVWWWLSYILIFALLAILAGVVAVGYFGLGLIRAFLPRGLRGLVYILMLWAMLAAFGIAFGYIEPWFESEMKKLFKRRKH